MTTNNLFRIGVCTVVLLCFAVAVPTCVRLVRGYSVFTVTVSKGRWIRIFAESSASTWSLYYEVYDNSTRVVGPYILITPPDADEAAASSGLAYSDRTYVARISRDRRICGITAKETPYTIYVLHDFDSGESWPYFEDSFRPDRLREGYIKRQSLRRRLEADYPDLSYRAKLHDESYLSSVSLRLNLDHTEVRGQDLQGLSRFPNIEALNLSFVAFTDEDLPILVALTNIVAVDLSGAFVTDVGVEWLTNNGIKVVR